MASIFSGTTVKQIDRLLALANSKDGNPRWEVVFSDGTTARTQVNAACAYGLGNPEYKAPNKVLVSFERGQITYVTPLASQP